MLRLNITEFPISNNIVWKIYERNFYICIETSCTFNFICSFRLLYKAGWPWKKFTITIYSSTSAKFFSFSTVLLQNMYLARIKKINILRKINSSFPMHLWNTSGWIIISNKSYKTEKDLEGTPCFILKEEIATPH